MAELSGGRISCPTWRVLRGVGQDSPFQSLLHHDYPSENCQKWRVYSVYMYIYIIYTRFSDTLICSFSNLLSKTGTVAVPFLSNFIQSGVHGPWKWLSFSAWLKKEIPQASGCGQAVNFFGISMGNFIPDRVCEEPQRFIMAFITLFSRHFFKTKPSWPAFRHRFPGDLLATDGMRKAPSLWTDSPKCSWGYPKIFSHDLFHGKSH